MATTEKLTAELDARDEFFSAVAHELRNPLNALHLTLAGLLRAQTGSVPLSSEQLVTRINRASSQVNRLAKLVDDMLDVSRISAGRFNLQFEEFDAAATLREVVERLQDLANPVPIALASPATLTVQCDRARFAQIAANLLSNAIAYGNRKPIEVRLISTAKVFRLEVEDHGIGIAEADQERIFERFAKLGTDTPNVRFGIGLWVTRELAQVLHGTIRVNSRLGEGSTFILELPCRSAVATGAASG